MNASPRLPTAQTGKHDNNETPLWDMCCHVHGHHEHSEYFFSVFDSDLTGDEADWLGTAVLPANSTAGSYVLALSGGEFEVDADAPAPTLTVSIPLFPPPPPPPQNIDAVKVAPELTLSRRLPSHTPPTHTQRQAPGLTASPPGPAGWRRGDRQAPL